MRYGPFRWHNPPSLRPLSSRLTCFQGLPLFSLFFYILLINFALDKPLQQISDDEDDTHPNVDTPSLFKWRHEARYADLHFYFFFQPGTFFFSFVQSVNFTFLWVSIPYILQTSRCAVCNNSEMSSGKKSTGSRLVRPLRAATFCNLCCCCPIVQFFTLS